VSRYRKIDVRLWADAKFKALSAPQPNAQTLWIYLLTEPSHHSVPGLFAAGERALAEALGWPLESSAKPLGEGLPEPFAKGFREVFSELSEAGMVKADFAARLVFIPNAIRYNAPANPNIVKGWKTYWDELPECALKDEARERVKDFLKQLGKPFAEAFGVACPNGSANGLANHEHEHEIVSPSPLKNGHHKKRKGKRAACELEPVAQRVVDHYQAVVAPPHGKEGGVVNVISLLRDGRTEEELTHAADAYAATAGEIQFRYKVRNFYGQKAYFKEFVNGQPSTMQTAEQWQSTPYIPK
jgi:hypothetical protein